MLCFLKRFTVEELDAEEAKAIDYEGRILDQELLPEDCLLEEGEERAVIERESYESPQFKELVNILVEWINDELAKHRIIVKNIEEDLYDGQILHKLLGELSQNTEVNFSRKNVISLIHLKGTIHMEMRKWFSLLFIIRTKSFWVT